VVLALSAQRRPVTGRMEKLHHGRADVYRALLLKTAILDRVESGLQPGEPMTGGCALEPLADDHTPEDGTNHVDRALGSFALNGPVISPVKQPCQKKAIMAASSFTKRIT